MAEHAMAHFHNAAGVPQLRVSVKEFMCIGAPPPFDHPHIFIDLGADGDRVCGYCSTRFVYDATLKSVCEPPSCLWDGKADRGAAA